MNRTRSMVAGALAIRSRDVLQISNSAGLFQFCFGVLGLVFAQQAFAFDADTHPTFTRAAVQAYLTCKGTSLSSSASEALIAGTKDEDASFATLGQRVTNWHFYNRNGLLHSAWFGRRSLDFIFAERITQLDEAISTGKQAGLNDVYRRAGRVLHYIQDMSVPAHVVPVFHANLLVWRRVDEFDQFERNSSAPVFSLNAQECDTLRSAALTNTPQTMLESTAQGTLLAVGQVGERGKTGNDSWKQYWVYPSPDVAESSKGWGKYGACGFLRGSKTPGCKSDAELDALFERQYRQTLNSSVLMLFYLEQRVSTQRTAAAIGFTAE